MSSATAIKAGAAYVELFLKDGLTKGLKAASARLKAWGGAMQSIGTKLLAVGMAAAAPMALATRTYASFADQMAVVRAVTAATDADFAKLTATAKRLGATTSFTARQVAQGMTSLGRAGFQPGQILAAIDGVLDLSRATETELGEAAEIAAGALRGFNLEAEQTGRVADVLTATANGSAQTLTDLGESLKYVAPVAVETGASIEETCAALAVLANNAIKGSLAGNALVRAYKNLATPAAQKELRGLGIAALDAQGDIRPLSTILAELGQKTAAMGSGRKLGIFESLFGRGSSSALKLASPQANYGDALAMTQGAAGRASATAKQMDDNLGGAFRRMMSAVEGVAIAVGDALAGPLGGLAEKIGEIAGVVTEFVGENKQLIVSIAKGAAAAVAIGAGMVAVGTAIVGVGAVLGGLAGIASAVATAFGVVTGVIGALLSPIGLVSAAVVGLAGYFAYSSGAIGKLVGWLKAQFDDLAGWFQGVWGGIRDAMAAGDLALAGRVAIGALKVAWAAGVNALTDAWIGFKTTVVETWHDVTYRIVDYAMKAWANLKIGFAETVAGLKILWADFAAGVADKWEGAQRSIARGLARQIAKAQGNDPEEAARAVDDEYNRRRRNRRAETEAYKSQVAAEMHGQDRRAQSETGTRRPRRTRKTPSAPPPPDVGNMTPNPAPPRPSLTPPAPTWPPVSPPPSPGGRPPLALPTSAAKGCPLSPARPSSKPPPPWPA